MLAWLAKLAALNVIGNFWGVSTRKVYHGARMFDIVFSIQKAITKVWNKIPVSYIWSHY